MCKLRRVLGVDVIGDEAAPILFPEHAVLGSGRPIVHLLVCLTTRARPCIRANYRRAIHGRQQCCNALESRIDCRGRERLTLVRSIHKSGVGRTIKGIVERLQERVHVPG